MHQGLFKKQSWDLMKSVCGFRWLHVQVMHFKQIITIVRYLWWNRGKKEQSFEMLIHYFERCDAVSNVVIDCHLSILFIRYYYFASDTTCICDFNTLWIIKCHCIKCQRFASWIISFSIVLYSRRLNVQPTAAFIVASLKYGRFIYYWHVTTFFLIWFYSLNSISLNLIASFFSCWQIFVL